MFHLLLWTPQTTVWHLYTSTLGLVNVTFLVADDDLTAEDFLIGLPILQHLQIDSKTLIWQKSDLLDDIDCSGVRDIPTRKSGGHFSRLMLARLKNFDSDKTVNTDDNDIIDATFPKVNYFEIRNKPDPFLDSTLLDQSTPTSTSQSSRLSNRWYLSLLTTASLMKNFRSYVASSTTTLTSSARRSAVFHLPTLCQSRLINNETPSPSVSAFATNLRLNVPSWRKQSRHWLPTVWSMSILPLLDLRPHSWSPKS